MAIVTNRQIAKAFRLASQLMELHAENAFKIRSLQNAAFKIEKLPFALAETPQEEIAAIEGIGKGTQQKISEFLARGSFDDLDQLMERTPSGIVEVLSIKGLGPKKVLTLWNELGIESVGELLYACNENRLVTLKGFGAKTQEQIKQAIDFMQSSSGFYLYSKAEAVGLLLLEELKKISASSEISFTGEMRRKCEIVSSVEIIIALEAKQLIEWLSGNVLTADTEISHNEITIAGCVAGKIECTIASTLPLILYAVQEKDYNRLLFFTTGSDAHISELKEGNLLVDDFSDEIDLYQKSALPFIEPELREGIFEFELIQKKRLNTLVRENDLKGILHNHTTYSDGMHTLEEMAVYCRDLGFEYLGICDHSKSAFYANGLSEARIEMQHKEIDKLNQQLFPFRIFKGIESDILTTGDLDYDESTLTTFDFVVASVHSVLRMDQEKATARLIKAIENPFTTILGHPTGRLLLSRQGYPIDFRKVIDACAANNVVIELNANPYRLDLDWRHIPYALEKGVMISINPDAHQKEGYHDMHYGVGAARKGGLSAAMTFNALTLSEIEKKFGVRRKY
ncbi:MAG: helix-hairpin-helix domain-containing protein [Bacteroidia bacterium]